jgi:hypothetical protein
MNRFIFIAFIVGVYLTISGGYDTWIQFGTSSKPTTISVAELTNHIPDNRNLNITDSCFLESEAVTYYRTSHYRKIEGSEITFIPIIPDSYSEGSETPKVLLKITDEKMKEVKDLSSVDRKSFFGIRKTHFDMENKVKDFLEDHFGKGSTDNMIIIEYGKWNSDQFINAVLKLLAGLVILGFIFRPNEQMIKEGFNFGK